MCIWACGLKISDLDLRGGVLSIHRLKGSLFTIQELERHRGIPLLDEVRALKEWLDEGKPVIKLELFHDTVPKLSSLSIGFEVLSGVSVQEARTLMDAMNEKIVGVIVTQK